MIVNVLLAVLATSALAVLAVIGYRWAWRPAVAKLVALVLSPHAADLAFLDHQVELRAHQIRCSRLEHSEGLRLPCSDPVCVECAATTAGTPATPADLTAELMRRTSELALARDPAPAVLHVGQHLTPEQADRIRDEWKRNALNARPMILAPNDLHYVDLPRRSSPSPRRTPR